MTLLAGLSLEREVIAPEGELHLAGVVGSGCADVTVGHDDSVDADGQDRGGDESDGEHQGMAGTDHGLPPIGWWYEERRLRRPDTEPATRA